MVLKEIQGQMQEVRNLNDGLITPLAALLFGQDRVAAGKLRPTLRVVFALTNLPWVKSQNQSSDSVGWLVGNSVGHNSRTVERARDVQLQQWCMEQPASKNSNTTCCIAQSYQRPGAIHNGKREHV